MNPAAILQEALSQGIHLFVEGGKLGFRVEKGCEVSGSLKGKIKQNKLLIIEYFREYGEQYIERKVDTIKPVAFDRSSLQLSYAQQRLWFIDQLEEGSAEYNMPAAFRVEGDFDLDAAEQAIVRIISRHESLRTVFKTQAENTLQIIQTEFEFKLTRYDLTSLNGEAQQAKAKSLILEDSLKSFDLSSDLMVRVAYLHLST